MAEQQDEQNKTEPATPFKLREAKKKGQVSKSLEVNSFVMLVVMLGMSFFAGKSIIAGQLQISEELLSNAHQAAVDPAAVIRRFEVVAGQVVDVYWPVIAVIMLVAVLSNMLQTGPVFTFFPLKPDMKKINPVTGLKRLFSKKLLFESIKTMLKMSLLGGIVYLVLKEVLHETVALHDISPDYYPLFILDKAQMLVAFVLLVFLIIAMADLAYTRWEFSQKMQMSHREIKEEVKRREGDPLIRSKRRELQKEALKRASSLSKVPDADVLITNPTHFAIALQYNRDTMAAPEVIAKGAGELAMKMRQLARKNNVPVIENKALARQLFKQINLDESISEELFPAVAKVLIWAFSMRDANRRANVSC